MLRSAFLPPSLSPPSLPPLSASALADLLSGLTLSATNSASAVPTAVDVGGGAGLSQLSTPLFPHQLTGLRWMQRREDAAQGEGLSPSGGIVADEAGLGKTLMTLALLLTHAGDACPCRRGGDAAQQAGGSTTTTTSTTLVVCPRGVVQQWVAEAVAHCLPGALSVLPLVAPMERTATAEALSAADVVVTSYDTVRAQHRRWKALRPEQRELASGGCALFALSFHRVVADEAHRLRNRSAQVTAATCALSARHRFFVTATPVHNSLHDLYAAFLFLRYAPYSDHRQWMRLIHTRDSRGLERARTLLQAVMLRRRKVLRPPADNAAQPQRQPALALPSTDVVLMPAKTVTTVRLAFKKQSATHRLRVCVRAAADGRLGSSADLRLARPPSGAL